MSDIKVVKGSWIGGTLFNSGALWFYNDSSIATVETPIDNGQVNLPQIMVKLQNMVFEWTGQVGIFQTTKPFGKLYPLIPIQLHILVLLQEFQLLVVTATSSLFLRQVSLQHSLRLEMVLVEKEIHTQTSNHLLDLDHSSILAIRLEKATLTLHHQFKNLTNMKIEYCIIHNSI